MLERSCQNYSDMVVYKARRRVAQLAEQWPPNPPVAGSSPVPPANFYAGQPVGGVAESGLMRRS